jgi:hypothetical protein
LRARSIWKKVRILARRRRILAFDLDGIKLEKAEVASHRQALGAAISKMSARHRRREYFLLSFQLHRKAVALAALMLFIVASLSISLIAISPQSGQAVGTLPPEQLREKILDNAKEIWPQAQTLKEESDLSNDNYLFFYPQDADGHDLGIVMAGSATGEIVSFMKFSSPPNSMYGSPNIRISVEEAKSIADAFLKSKGADLDGYEIEGDPLICNAVEGPPQNPIFIYQYDFHYQLQINGLFVDDLQYHGGWCRVAVSPDDGAVLSYTLPQNFVSLKNLPYDDINLTKQDAIAVAMEKEKARSEAVSGAYTPVADEEEGDLRYVVSDNRLVPYWKITIRHQINDASASPPLLVGGCVYWVSASDGRIVYDDYLA